jgi:hypothetical protein
MVCLPSVPDYRQDTAQGRQCNVDPDGRFLINTELDRLSDHPADELNLEAKE